MNLTRREMLSACAGVALGAVAAPGAPPERPRLGVASYSFHQRLAAERGDSKPGLADPLTFLDYCRQLGAGGVQLGLGARDAEYLKRLREKADAAQLFVEGSVRLPQ